MSELNESPPEDTAFQAPDSPKGELSPPSRRGISGAVLFLVGIIALVAAGTSGYLLYLYQTTHPLEKLAGDLAVFEQQTQTAQDALLDQLTGLRDSVNERFTQQATEVAALKQQLSALRNRQINAAAPTRREWVLAEVEYLLRIANQRLVLERDAAGALQMLRAADQNLAALEDFSLTPVRAQLAEEILALDRLKQVDVQGIFLKLDALKNEIDQLPLRLPTYTRDTPSPPTSTETSTSLWQQFMERLKSAFEFRRYDKQGVKPLLSPQEAGYLELNLRLMFERAQLSLLRRDATLYQNSVDDILRWLEEYINLQDPTAEQMHQVLVELEQVDIEQALPDISGSLNSLLQLRRYSEEPVQETVE